MGGRDRPRRGARSGPVKVRVPAKINLHLGVGPLRADGYHELATIYHAIALFDEVTARPADSLALTMDGEGAGTLPLDDTNLVHPGRARRSPRSPGAPPHARLHLRKQIPLAAGLAGGSADAAATLVACDALWGTGFSREDLAERRRRRSARTSRSWCSAAPRSAPGAARRSTRCWRRATPGTGWSRSPTAGCPPRTSTASWTGCATAGDRAGLGRRRRRDPGRAAPARPGRARRRPRQRPAGGRAVAAPGAAPTPSTPGTAAGALAGLVSGSGPTCVFLVPRRRRTPTEPSPADLEAGARSCRAVGVAPRAGAGRPAAV